MGERVRDDVIREQCLHEMIETTVKPIVRKID
jgi:hypothetical protein